MVVAFAEKVSRRAAARLSAPIRLASSPSVRNILHSSNVQSKLTLGAANDPAEAEADRVADQMMRMPEPAARGASLRARTSTGSVPIRRRCANCESELQRMPADDRVQRMEEDQDEIKLKRSPETVQRLCPHCAAERDGAGEEPLRRRAEVEEDLVQTKEAPCGTTELPPAPESLISGIGGGGAPLSASERAFFEPRFGRDFSGVRIHDGMAASTAARSINARAYTLGNDIAFARGEYGPGSLKGRRLMAHELAHVTQHREPRIIQRAPKADEPDPFATAGRREARGEAQASGGSAQADDLIQCGPDVGFAVESFRTTMRPRRAAPRASTVDFSPWVFRAVAWVRGVGSPEALSEWRIGFTQTVNSGTKAGACYAAGTSVSNLIDTPMTDCDPNKQTAWMDKNPKTAKWHRRRLAMDDAPTFEAALVDKNGNPLASMCRDFSATAFLVVQHEPTRKIFHLRWCRWGFIGAQLRLSSIGLPTNEDRGSEFFPQGRGDGGNAFRFNAAICANDVPNTGGTCICPKSQAPVAGETTPDARGGSELADAETRSDNGARTGRLQRKPDTSKERLAEQIRQYRNACSEVGSVKCVGGEIVPEIPECVDKAPCGIAQCVFEHETRHGDDIVKFFAENLGRHPCRHQDGRPFRDGFSGFGEDFVGETGDKQKWRRFLLGSERRAYRDELRCLRETRRRSSEPLCKRALTSAAATAAYRRFLALIGIFAQ